MMDNLYSIQSELANEADRWTHDLKAMSEFCTNPTKENKQKLVEMIREQKIEIDMEENENKMNVSKFDKNNCGNQNDYRYDDDTDEDNVEISDVEMRESLSVKKETSPNIAKWSDDCNEIRRKRNIGDDYDDNEDQDYIEISDDELTESGKREATCHIPKWCQDRDQIRRKNWENQKVNPVQIFGECQDLVIDLYEVFPESSKTFKDAPNWSRDKLTDIETQTYLKFMRWQD